MQLHSIAQPQLPDLSGQPPWVVVVVSLLFVAGWVGTRWAARGRDRIVEAEEDAEESRPLTTEGVASALTAPEHHATAVIMRALELLHEEAEESRDGREEAAQWRRKAEGLQQLLEDCQQQLDGWPRRHESPEGASE